jgi:hypothetical protein
VVSARDIAPSGERAVEEHEVDGELPEVGPRASRRRIFDRLRGQERRRLRRDLRAVPGAEVGGGRREPDAARALGALDGGIGRVPRRRELRGGRRAKGVPPRDGYRMARPSIRRRVALVVPEDPRGAVASEAPRGRGVEPLGGREDHPRRRGHKGGAAGLLIPGGILERQHPERGIS